MLTPSDSDWLLAREVDRPDVERADRLLHLDLAVPRDLDRAPLEPAHREVETGDVGHVGEQGTDRLRWRVARRVLEPHVAEGEIDVRRGPRREVDPGTTVRPPIRTDEPVLSPFIVSEASKTGSLGAVVSRVNDKGGQVS